MLRPLLLTGFVIALAVGWWLGSPLFIRTSLNEALPSISPLPAVSPAATTVAVAVTPQPARSGQLQYVDSLHYGKGTVRVLETLDPRLLRFEEVAISNAPDIQIYLSTDIGGRYEPANTVHLGALKATNGSFNYEIPRSLDLARYKSVVVWCRAFNVLVSWADLG